MTIRNGFVRITSTDVYKGEAPRPKSPAEYENVPNYSGRILFVGLVLVTLVVTFIITHWNTVSLCTC